MKRTLIFIHRWLGVVLCLFFLLWFPSGFVMMYWDYPSVTPADRLAHLAPIDPASIKVSIEDAAAKAEVETPGALRLTTFAGRPIYRFGGRGERRQPEGTRRLDFGFRRGVLDGDFD